MKTFDDIAVLRPELAASSLQLLLSQPGRPMALFANRRVGKTFCLDHDLAPAALKAHLLPVYADLWLERSNPLEAVNHALQEALDQATADEGPYALLALLMSLTSLTRLPTAKMRRPSTAAMP